MREAGRDAAALAGIAAIGRRNSLARMAHGRLEWTFAGHGGSRYLSVRRNARAAQALLERAAKAIDARLNPPIRHAPNFAPHAAG
jgi:hypothetical protein